MSQDNENQSMDYFALLEEGQSYLMQATLELDAGHTLEFAEKCFSDAIDIAPPKDIRAYLQRGALYQEQGKFAQAIDDFNRAVELNSQNTVAHLRLGDIYRVHGKFEEALVSYNYALNNLHFPNNNFKADFLLSRGQIYQEQKKFDMALDDFNQAIKFKKELRKNPSEAYQHKGMLLIEQGYFEKALESFKLSIAFTNDENKAERKKSILVEAHSHCIKLDKFDLARECIDIAFRGYGASQTEMKNKQRYLEQIEIYEKNEKLTSNSKELQLTKNKMKQMASQYSHTMANHIFPQNILEVAVKIKNDFPKEYALLIDAYEAEEFIIHQGQLLKHRHFSEEPKRFRVLIREGILVSSSYSESLLATVSTEEIINRSLKRVISRFLDKNYPKFNRTRQTLIEERDLSLHELRESFQSHIFIESQSPTKWIHINLFPVKIYFSESWESIKLKENSFAHALLQSYFYELFFNIFKYSDYEGIELQFDEQEVSQDTYLVAKWKNFYIDNKSFGDEQGLKDIRKDLCRLYDSPIEEMTLQIENNIGEKSFQVTLPIKKDLLIQDSQDYLFAPLK